MYVWYSNWCVMWSECPDHHVSFSLSSHHTGMHNMSEYLPNGFWSHCDLMTMREKSRKRYMFRSLDHTLQQTKGFGAITSNWLTINEQLWLFPYILFCLLSRGVETNNNNYNRTTDHFLSVSNLTINPELYYIKPFHGSYSMFPKGKEN